MKSLILSLLVCSFLQADYIRWFNDFEKAHQTALKEDKALMVLLVKEIDNVFLLKVFSDDSLIKGINEKYISVIIKKDQSSSYPIEMLYTIEYPSLFFLDKHELYKCEALRGDFSSDDLKKHLRLCD